MWILDTDHLTLIERGGNAALSLQLRLGQVPVSEVDTTIVNYEEQMRGWLSTVAHVDTPEKLISVYGWLRRHTETFRDFRLLPFDQTASMHLERLQQSRVRIGTMDLRIAAICLANNATLLTRNLKDFRQVPGLKVEGWSA